MRTDTQLKFLYYPLNIYIYIYIYILAHDLYHVGNIAWHITRNTNADSSIRFFLAKIFPENRGMKIIWLSIYKVKSKLLDFRCYGNTSNKFYIFRELGREVWISDHFRLPVSVSATSQNFSLFKKFSLNDGIS